jgi:DNA invertase Pin-like site-specific DNA recombinase
MAAAVLRPSETKSPTFDNQSQSSDWANLYSGVNLQIGVRDNVETMHKNNRIMAYIRDSTTDQNPEMQKTWVLATIASKGINPDDVEWFIDHGVSATKKQQMTDRPEGEKVWKALENGEVESIFCYKLDRLFRKQWAAHKFVAECQLQNTDVFSIDTPSGLLSDEGFLLYSVNFMMAEMEARRLARRTTDGMSQARNNGGVTTNAVFGWDVMEVIDENGNPLIGKNDKVVKKMKPNWQEQAVLNWIREQVSLGKSHNWIARKLNEIGLKGKKGGKWQSQSVKRTLESKQHLQIGNESPPKQMMKWPFADLRKKQA